MRERTGKDTTEQLGRGFLPRQAALIAVTAVLVTGGAFAYASLATPIYTAHARVLVEPLTLPTAVQREPDMGTEAAVTTSSAVLVVAAARLHRSLNTVSDAVDVTVPINADVLDIGYSSPDPLVARNGATAVAAAYRSYRARTSSNSAANRLAAPGVQTRLVTPAARPAQPSSPDTVVDVLAGLVVGSVAGVALAFATDRFGRRIRSVARWQEITGVPVIAGLTGVLASDDRANDEIAKYGTGGAHGADGASRRAVRYLRMRVGQALPPHGAVLLVAAIAEHDAGAGVARDLAQAFVDAGRSGVLVELTPDDDDDRPGAAAALDVAGRPADLSIRVTLPAMSGHGLCPAQDWRPVAVAGLLALIARYRARYDVVLVSAPPPLLSITALDVAAIADGALVVDHAASSSRAAASRVVADVRAVGCRVVGGVLLGLRAARVGDGAPVARWQALTGRADPREPDARPRPGNGDFAMHFDTVPLNGRPRALSTAPHSENGGHSA